MFLTQLVGFTAKVVSLGLQLFVQSELMFVHLRLEFVLQSQQLFLVLPLMRLYPDICSLRAEPCSCSWIWRVTWKEMKKREIRLSILTSDIKKKNGLLSCRSVRSSQERLCGWWRNGLCFGAASSERPTTAAAETPSLADMGRRKYYHVPDRRMDKKKISRGKDRSRRLCTVRHWLRTEGRWMMELLDVTVCSPSCIMAISALSSEPSARLLTEELWELALMDIEGTDWELSILFTVPVCRRYCSASYTHTQTKKDVMVFSCFLQYRI